jgi:addiction module HigA family antidote
MVMTKRKPASPGILLVEEFLEPMGMSQTELAQQSGLPRKHVNELCRDRRAITADTALILARVFGNSPDFWLNTQRRTDLWEALNTPSRRMRIQRAKPLRKRLSAQAA